MIRGEALGCGRGVLFLFRRQVLNWAEGLCQQSSVLMRPVLLALPDLGLDLG